MVHICAMWQAYFFFRGICQQCEMYVYQCLWSYCSDYILGIWIDSCLISVHEVVCICDTNEAFEQHICNWQIHGDSMLSR